MLFIQPKNPKRYRLTALALACVPYLAQADNGPSEAPAARTSNEKLSTVTVTGNPLRSNEAPGQLRSLAGDDLTLQRGTSLGDTLSGLSGVGSSYFGPNANRPTIRGLDGDRVRLMSNSGASVDASSLSFDHAVPIDPLVIERVEVLRGASALLYGGNALGGVVNTLDNRIPRQRQAELSGVTEFRLGGANGERSAAAVLDGGAGDWAWHADLAGRRTSDLRVPRFTDSEGQTGQRVRNSASDSQGGALGTSRQLANGYVGLSFDGYRSDYGVTVEPDVKIKMERQRLANAGELRWSDGPLRRLRWQASASRYEHREIEGDGAVGTVFNSRGKDLRIEAEHEPLGSLRGVIGTQLERSDFSALGEEALVPTTRTRSAALFVLEQLQLGDWHLSAGARREQVRINSDGDGADAAEPRFGAPDARRFKPGSVSLSANWHLSSSWELALNLNQSERSPTFAELYANGIHVASGAFERGDRLLGLEKARGAELSLGWEAHGAGLRLGLYRTRFSNYIALQATGEQVDDGEGGEQPVYAYHGVRAQLQGFELEAHQEWKLAAGSLKVSAALDAVRGTELATGEPLPRLAPMKAVLAAEWRQGPWSNRLEWRGVARQDRVPALDRATAGYGTVRLAIARQFRLGENDALWYLRLDNLGNQLAFNAGSPLTIRGLAPLPGRAVQTGVQFRF
ncbi:TonB-dependent receptor [Pelomonas sp. SE-A7]|uniref:TonB-dependent receptor n=1 Tax=Pelomonas sp. SE-A7 TaxID=3054953 RepID=UPI00259CDC51|nr:TonB-dependent receptor [Pelomonas sp. SE-A7]MDM4765119.1 TonB-dependent receptor [Pelomonas sp. SE-A7]